MVIQFNKYANIGIQSNQRRYKKGLRNESDFSFARIEQFCEAVNPK